MSTDWLGRPLGVLQVRQPGERFVERPEGEWPLGRTRWTKLYLSPAAASLVTEPLAGDASVSYAGFGDGVTFLTPPLDVETEITGPLAAKLWVASQTTEIGRAPGRERV